MAKSEAQISNLVKPILRTINNHLSRVTADFPEMDGSPANPSVFESTEPVEKNIVELYSQKYGKDILAADTYEEFSELVLKIASLEGLNVNTDLDEVAKNANLIRERHGLEPL